MIRAEDEGLVYRGPDGARGRWVGGLPPICTRAVIAAKGECPGLRHALLRPGRRPHFSPVFSAEFLAGADRIVLPAMPALRQDP